MRIPTLDGDVITVGYLESDTSRVMLGELPPMHTQQFLGYAAIAIAQGILPDLDPDTRATWATDAHDLHDMVKDTPTPKITSMLISQAFAPADGAVYYAKSPFLVRPSGKRVDFMQENTVVHKIDREQFFSLTCRVIHDGWAWHTTGQAEPGVVKTARELRDAFKAPRESI